MQIQDLETPSILIDLDIMERNIATIQRQCDALGLQFRPHTKTHKIPAIAQKQIEAGAVGLACQKLTEADIFIEAGFKDIQLPYNIVGEKKTAHLAELAKRAKMSVTVDSLAVIEGIAAAAKAADVTIHILIELVSLQERTGTSPEKALELAQAILKHHCLHFAGLMIYPAEAGVRPRLLETMELLKGAGIPIETVSSGGSGALLEAHSIPELTELRIGTYVFYDWNSVAKNWTSFDDCAMRIRVTVVSANDIKRVIVDSGSKTLNAETLNGCYGYLTDYPEARIYKLNEEHGYIDFSAYGKMPQVGDILHIIPVHTCVVTNLHNRVFAHRGDEIEAIYEVAARGLVW
jgi:D-serine deaminase-like pyridoxal phosphate-dependent protein